MREGIGRPLAATSSDELRRLVDDFTQMARRSATHGRKPLERTHASRPGPDMALRSAHDSRTLDPYSLSRRARATRNRTRTTALAGRSTSAITSVRRIELPASDLPREFSSFASAPPRTGVDRAGAGAREEVVEP